MSEDIKRLTRSKTDRWLGGVCGGLGHYFGVDPTIIRALFVLFALAVGGGILAYIILWIIIPLESDAVEETVDISFSGEEEETDS